MHNLRISKRLKSLSIESKIRYYRDLKEFALLIKGYYRLKAIGLNDITVLSELRKIFPKYPFYRINKLFIKIGINLNFNV